MSAFHSIFREVLRGKSASRSFTNVLLSGFKVKGLSLDVGGIREESHYRYLGLDKGVEIKTLNLRTEENPDYAVDLEKSSIPVEDEKFETVLCFNVLEHIENYEKVIGEIYRVLKTDGHLIGSVPFLVNVHPDPHDFQRFTSEKLERVFRQCGFSEIDILPASYGPFVAGYTQVEMFIPRFLKPLWFLIAYAKDAFLLRFFDNRFPFKERFVLAYVFYCKK